MNKSLRFSLTFVALLISSPSMVAQEPLLSG